MYPRRRWLCLGSRAEVFTLQGRHRRSVGDSAFHTSCRGAPLVVSGTPEGVTICNLIPNNVHTVPTYAGVPSTLYVALQLCCTVLRIHTVVRQSALSFSSKFRYKHSSVVLFMCVCVCLLSSHLSGRQTCGRTSRGY